MALGSALTAAGCTRLPLSSGLDNPAKTYYVDPVNGDDARSATQAKTRTTAWRTIRHAIDAVTGNGSVIKVLPGTFQSQGLGTQAIYASGKTFSTSDPLTVMAETPYSVVIQPTQVDNSWGGYILNCVGIRIQGFVFDPITNPGSQLFQSGFVIDNSDKIEIFDNLFYGSGEKGINIRGGASGSGQTSDDIWIFGNIFRPKGTDPFAYVSGIDFPIGTYYGCRGSHWIYMGGFGSDPGGAWDQINGARRFVIANNVFVGSTKGRMVEVGPAGRDGFVVNNTFYGNHNVLKYTNYPEHPYNWEPTPNQAATNMSGGGIIQYANASSQTYKSGNNVFANNIFKDLDGHAVSQGSGAGESGSICTKNLSHDVRSDYGYAGSGSVDYQPLGNGSNTPAAFTTTGNFTEADPLFNDANIYDFTLREGSPAIGVADPQYCPSIDITGTDRSETTPSLGAYEVATAPPAAGKFGKDTVGGSLQSAIASGKKIASKAVIAPGDAPFQVNRIRWYLATDAATQVAKAEIYADNAGAPGALLYTSSEVFVGAGQSGGWVDFPIDAAPSLSAGTYWIAILTGETGGNLTAYYDSGGNSVTIDDTYADGPSDPFGSITSGSLTLDAGSGDGRVNVTSSTVYPPVAGANGGVAGYDDASGNLTITKTLATTFSVYNGLLQFDTSGLPDDATITAATLKLYVISSSNADGRSLVGEYYDWGGSVGNSDYSSTAPASPCLAATIASLTSSAINDIDFSDFSGISKTGVTRLRLHISGGQPTGTNQVSGLTSAGATPPDLVVEYTTGQGGETSSVTFSAYGDYLADMVSEKESWGVVLF